MRARAAIALLAAVLLAGCGGASRGLAGGERPDMTAWAEGDLALDYPSTWTRRRDQEGDGGLVLFAAGPSDVDGFEYRLTLFDQKREYATVRAYGKSASDTRAFATHGEVVGDGPARVAGSEGAWKVVTDYRVNPSTGGKPVPARAIDIMPIRGDRQYRLTLSGPRKDMDGALVQAIVDSLRIRGAGTQA